VNTQPPSKIDTSQRASLGTADKAAVARARELVTAMEGGQEPMLRFFSDPGLRPQDAHAYAAGYARGMIAQLLDIIDYLTEGE
jgi:hypothetical protein